MSFKSINRKTARTCASLFLCGVGTVAILGLTIDAEPPFTVRLVSVTEAEATRKLAVEFRKCNPTARFSEGDLKIQVRIAGRWQPPEPFPQLSDSYDFLLARTKCEQVIFTVPREAEACRLRLGYRVGQRPYCQAYFFLQRHGWIKQMPKLSRLLLKCVPSQPRLRHLEYTLKV